jgi:hypothetical protein
VGGRNNSISSKSKQEYSSNFSKKKRKKSTAVNTPRTSNFSETAKADAVPRLSVVHKIANKASISHKIKIMEQSL